ncbi:mitochondrial fusion and transport protein ugo1 [Trapelia coarctata]|nr:mitochondrial fusion and transport protein ugo1 [Trapelia coarctata]
MSGPREGPNPLRPYYIPPSVGPRPLSGTNSSAAANLGSKPNSFSDPRPSLGSSARDLLSDLDYSEYLSDSPPSAAAAVKELVDRALWKYSSVLLAQPFEVAKTVLQVQLDASPHGAFTKDMRRRPARYREETYDIPSDESDPDESSYFTSAAPLNQTPSGSINLHRRRNDRYRSPHSPSSASPSPPSSPRPTLNSHHIPPTAAVSHVISHLWSTEGAWGIWKGTNSTFIHSVLLSTITAFVRSLLCALLALPDPGVSISQSTPPYLISIPSAVGGLDVTSSPYPLISLATAVSAAGIAGVILAPVDIARTRLMLTPSTHPPRSLIPALKSLPSWIVPPSIAVVTFVHSTLPTLISASTPVFLRSRLGIDPVLTPNMYALATFGSQVFELGVRLPIETVLRRGQIAVVTSSPSAHQPPFSRSSASSFATDATYTNIQTSVEVGPYKGFFGTIYHIVFEVGSRGEPETPLVNGKGGPPAVKVTATAKAKGGKRKKGQGVEGLFRGWRVGMWGLVGVWGAATLGGVGTKGGEF